MELSERNMELILERDKGKTLPALAVEFSLSESRVNQITAAARHHLDDLELDLMKAAKTGEAVGLAIPHGPGRTVAIDYFDWVVRELRKRDIKLEVEHRPTVNGSVLFLFDRTYEKSEEA